ncbi:MAG: putative peptidoglycan glycosyltransferase FtsW [Pseudomonadota bacterium]
MKMPSRLDTGPLARWWWSVDHLTLGVVGLIIAIGVALIMAAGPVAAARLSHVDVFYFPVRQLIFLGPAIAIMVCISFLSPLFIRRLGVIAFAVSLTAMVLVLLIAEPINGAQRWLDLGPMLLQPSEFGKTGFILTAAWMLAEGARDRQFPGALIAMGLYLVVSALLLLQPDVGQWLLVTAAWVVMFFIAGISWFWLAAVGGFAACALVAAYYFFPHVSRRIDGFLDPNAADNYQVEKATEAIANGGGFGMSASEGAVKHQLPDAHADFIFAVAGEEFGFFFCLVIIALFATFVGRSFFRAFSVSSIFIQCAICGLSAMVGFQAIINIGVNLRMFPAKGMTLPFISYGGSSLMAMALAVGCVLALTRRQHAVTRRCEIMP